MMRSRSFRAAIGVVMAALVTTQGCYVYRPAPIPTPVGANVRVSGAPLDIYGAVIAPSAITECRASHIYGKLRESRGDTIVIGPVSSVRNATPESGCRRMPMATVVAPPATTSIEVGRFSAGRTAGVVVGVLAAAALIGVVVYANTGDLKPLPHQ
jgi:hypothetical protein